MNIRAKRPLIYTYTLSSLRKKDFVTMKEIENVRNSFFNHMTTHLITKAVEIGPVYKQLHEHGIIVTHTLYQTSRFYIHMGFKIQLKICTNIDGAWQYVHKNDFQCHSIINQYNGESEAISPDLAVQSASA